MKSIHVASENISTCLLFIRFYPEIPELPGNSDFPTGLVYVRFLKAHFQFLTADYKQEEEVGEKG